MSITTALPLTTPAQKPVGLNRSQQAPSDQKGRLVGRSIGPLKNRPHVTSSKKDEIFRALDPQNRPDSSLDRVMSSFVKAIERRHSLVTKKELERAKGRVPFNSEPLQTSTSVQPKGTENRTLQVVKVRRVTFVDETPQTQASATAKSTEDRTFQVVEPARRVAFNELPQTPASVTLGVTQNRTFRAVNHGICSKMGCKKLEDHTIATIVMISFAFLFGLGVAIAIATTEQNS